MVPARSPPGAPNSEAGEQLVGEAGLGRRRRMVTRALERKCSRIYIREHSPARIVHVWSYQQNKSGFRAELPLAPTPARPSFE